MTFLEWLNEQIQITLQKYREARESQDDETAHWFMAKLRTYEEVKEKTEED